MNDQKIMEDRYENAYTAQIKNIENYNKSESDAVKQLIFIATVFFTASLFMIDKSEVITTGYKILLISSWIQFGLSMIIGVAIFIKDRNFFDTWTIRYGKISELAAKNLVSSENFEAVAKVIEEGAPTTSGNYLIFVQTMLLIGGVICLLITASSSIF